MIFYQDCSSHLDLSKNMATRGRGLFSLYIYIENLKNLLVRNHWTNFHILLQKCSFGNPLPRLFKQGGHALWKTGKTGKMVRKKSLQGKIREFEILLKIREKSGNFKKSYLCKVKIFKFYSCSNVATGGFFLPYA